MTKWLNRTLITSNVPYQLCTTEKQFNKLVKSFNKDYKFQFLLEGADACMHTISQDGMPIANIVTINPWLEKTEIEMYCILVHEAVHVWQTNREAIGERFPSDEFEAYSIQAISENLIKEYQKQVKPKTKKKKAK